MAAYTTIDDPSAYFKVQLYVGNATTGKTVVFDDTDTNMSPDFIWIKNRDGADPHHVFDNVRTVGQRLRTNQTDVASFVDASDDLQQVRSHDSDGFTLGNNTDVNGNTENFVAWCWKAGTTSGITTTGADITPSAYSFSATAGFSIIKYTGSGTSGDRVAHGLGSTPEFFIVRNTEDGDEAFMTYHKNLTTPAEDFLSLNTTAAEGTATWAWNNESPNSNTIVVSNNDATNGSSDTMIAWVWRGIQGFSKFGKYTGNGNADGTFVYTGFKPAFTIIKDSGNSADWVMHSKGMNDSNPMLQSLEANGTASQYTTAGKNIDYLSNGFKCRGTDTAVNGSGRNFVYIAFAEAPFVNSNGVPCNAR